jgi:hypothetical protein
VSEWEYTRMSPYYNASLQLLRSWSDSDMFLRNTCLSRKRLYGIITLNCHSCDHETDQNLSNTSLDVCQPVALLLSGNNTAEFPSGYLLLPLFANICRASHTRFVYLSFYYFRAVVTCSFFAWRITVIYLVVSYPYLHFYSKSASELSYLQRDTSKVRSIVFIQEFRFLL